MEPNQNFNIENKAFFGRWARVYDLEKYFLAPFRRYAARFASLDPAQRVLDVATGTGALAFEFAKLGHEVIGVDLSPDMLVQARKKESSLLRLSFQEADGTNLPFQDGLFDLSAISLAIHDMPFEIGVRVLKEMRRVTKPSGRLLLVDYMEPRKHKAAKITHRFICLYETKYYRPFIEKGVGAYIDAAGLNVVAEGNYLGVCQLLLLR